MQATISVSTLRNMVADLPTLTVGRVIIPELAFAEPAEAPRAGVAFGALDDDARSRWIGALTMNALVIQVVVVPSAGVRALFARFTQRVSDRMPIDDACTGLFLAGVRELYVYEVEGRRDLRAILGRRGA